MTHLQLARLCLAVLCGLQGAATLAIDLSRTHATNPRWTGHARFHVVWQTANIAFLSALAMVLIYGAGPVSSFRFYLAAALTGLPMLSFFAALFARGAYGGTLSDPNGMPQARLVIAGRERCIDMNLVAEIVGLVVLVADVLFYWMSAQANGTIAG